MPVPPRRCVYTVLTGNYEPLSEQPAARDSTLPFICFTDTPDIASATWQIRPFTPPFTDDHIRNQRTGKLRPHALLPDFDQSLYIDNAVLLSQPPEHLFAAADLTAGLSLPRHSFRATLLDEFAAVAEQSLDDPARIAELLGHYMSAFPDLLWKPPLWSAIMLRDHHHPGVQSAMEIWLAHVFRYSRRDQLSSLAAFHLAGLTPAVLEIDNHISPYHSWPHLAGRKAAQRLWQAGPSTALMDRIEVTSLKHRLDQLEHEHRVLLASTTWRLLAPARALLRRFRN